MKISVIIPTYNRSSYLEELLLSLAKQTFKDFEILICDDGSTDNTKQIVELFQKKHPNIRYFFDLNWGGPAKPRNIGIRESVGEWISFLDSDDLWTENKLFEINKALTDDVDIVYHPFFTNDSKKTIIGKYVKSLYYKHFEDLLVNGNKIVNSSLTVRRSMLIKVNGFSEDKGLIGVEDYDLTIRLAMAGSRFFLVNKILGTYRLNESNISSDYLQQVNKVEYMQQQYKKYCSKKIHSKMDSLISYLKGSYFIKYSLDEGRRFLLLAAKSGSFQIKIKSVFKICFSYFK